MRLGGPLEHGHPVAKMLDLLFIARPPLRQKVNLIELGGLQRLQGKGHMTAVHRIKRPGINSNSFHAFIIITFSYALRICTFCPHPL